jgi:hypothetical protein
MVRSLYLEKCLLHLLYCDKWFSTVNLWEK